MLQSMVMRMRQTSNYPVVHVRRHRLIRGDHPHVRGAVCGARRRRSEAARGCSQGAGASGQRGTNTVKAARAHRPRQADRHHLSLPHALSSVGGLRYRNGNMVCVHHALPCRHYYCSCMHFGPNGLGAPSTAAPLWQLVMTSPCLPPLRVIRAADSISEEICSDQPFMKIEDSVVKVDM